MSANFIFENNSRYKLWISRVTYPFKRQAHKIAKHTQTIRRQIE